MIPTLLKERYSKRIEDIEKHSNDKTRVKILISLKREPPLQLELVTECPISDINKVYPETYINILEFANPKVNTYLKNKNIHFFVPLGSPSYDIDEKNNILEIGYYHDDKKYEIMYMPEEGWINMPHIGRDHLEELHVEHYLYQPKFDFKYYFE